MYLILCTVYVKIYEVKEVDRPRGNQPLGLTQLCLSRLGGCLVAWCLSVLFAFWTSSRQLGLGCESSQAHKFGHLMALGQLEAEQLDVAPPREWCFGFSATAVCISEWKIWRW